MSVTSATTAAVVVAALDWPPCPPGRYCGATATVLQLVIPWSGAGRPVRGTVIDLFGITTTGSLSPVGFVTTDGCFIDWC